MTMMFTPSQVSKAGHGHHSVARVQGQHSSAQETPNDSGAAGEFKTLLEERSASASNPPSSQLPPDSDKGGVQQDNGRQVELAKAKPTGQDITVETNLLSELLKRIEAPSAGETKAERQKDKAREGEQIVESTAQSLLALMVAPVAGGQAPAQTGAPAEKNVDANISNALDPLEIWRNQSAEDHGLTAPEVDAQPFEGAVVLSAEVRSFPELTSHRASLIELREPSIMAATAAQKVAEPTLSHSTQSLNVVLALPDTEPLRCTVRNLGDALSITVATSDPQTVAYLRDNDQLLRANLERIGIQTDTMQVRLTVAPPQAGQDSGQPGSQGQPQSGFYGAESGQRQNNQSPHQRQPNPSSQTANDDQARDDRTLTRGRYL